MKLHLIAEVDKGLVCVKVSPGKGNGLFAAKDIPSGTVICHDKVSMISDEDWKLMKDSKLVDLYGFKWYDTHAMPFGPVNYPFAKSEKEKLSQVKLFKGKNPIGLSYFVMLNHDDHPNAKQVIGKDFVEVKTIKDIKKGEEITKKYDAGGRAKVEKES
jgi:SET domain-containing protein